MKKTLLLILLFFVAKLSIAQYQVLYEGGFGTPNSLHKDWGQRWHLYGGEGVSETSTIMCASEDSNRIELMTHSAPLGTNFEVRSGIYKTIPYLDQYTSFRIIVGMHLPDSIRELSYNYLTLDTANQQQISIYDQFAGNSTDSMIDVSNTAGNNTIFLEVNLFQADSVKVRFDYIRIEVDTTTNISQSGISQPYVGVSSYQSSIVIQTNNSTDSYTMELFNPQGNQIYQANLSGNQTITPGVESGIYFARISSVNGVQETTVYIE